MNTYDFLTQIKGGKQLSQADDVRAYVVDVTPEVAGNFLMLNFEHNRPQRPTLVRRWIAKMDRGEFVEGSPIRIANRGGEYVLTDGQHRLSAIAESGLAATLTVIVTDKAQAQDVRDEYANVDTEGMSRSIKDSVMALDADEVLPINDKLRYYSAAAKLICGNFSFSSSRLAKDISRQRVYETLLDYKDGINLLSQWFKDGIKTGRGTMRSFLRAGVLSVAMVTTKYAETPVVESFWREAYLDDGLRKNDPRKKLYEHLYGGGKGSGSKVSHGDMMVAAKCWNAYVAGEEIVQLKMPKSMPNIALTPYPLKEEMPTEE